MKKVIDFNRLPKQEYMKPQMKVVLLQHQSHLLTVSNGAKSLNNTDGFTLHDNLDEDDV